jgi:16S rRNA (guanine(1405)-N(7))-methyltransferase
MSSSKPPETGINIQHQILQELAVMLATKVIKKYRVDQARAVAMAIGYFEKKPELLKLVSSATQLKSVTRTRIYKDAERDVTRKIYYDLRRYQEQDDISCLIDALSQAQTPEALEAARLALVRNHVSTSERLAHTQEFWQSMFQHWGQPRRVLDVGCGILPLLFPFDDMPLEQYVALDKSADSVSTISAYQKSHNITGLSTAQWSIDQGWDVIHDPQEGLFDVAFLLKLVPVVARQEPESLSILARTPAKRLIVTGCKTAMVKQKDISRRERIIVLDFVEQAGLEVLETFETPDEIGFVLSREK